MLSLTDYFSQFSATRRRLGAITSRWSTWNFFFLLERACEMRDEYGAHWAAWLLREFLRKYVRATPDSKRQILRLPHDKRVACRARNPSRRRFFRLTARERWIGDLIFLPFSFFFFLAMLRNREATAEKQLETHSRCTPVLKAAWILFDRCALRKRHLKNYHDKR